MNKRMGKRILFLLVVLIFLFSTYKVVTILYGYKQSQMVYQEIEQTAEIEEKTEETQIDFMKLQQINDEVIGWLMVEGTDISYPVVQHEDNTYYLHHLFNGQENSAGSIFLDAHNSRDFSDQHSIIYGHNMKDDTMFGQLEKFQDEAFFRNHQAFTLITETKTYQVDIFAAYIADTQDEIWQMTFQGEEFQDWVNQIAQKSIIQNGVVPAADDRIVTLATCSNGAEDERFVVVGKIREMTA